MNAHSSVLAYPAALTGRPHGSLAPLVGNLNALALAVGAQDPYTQGHSRRVAEYAVRMAERMGLDAGDRELVRTGGLLHDIGKLAFSRKLLANRNRRLTPEMRAEIRRHPEIGEQLLKALSVPAEVVACVRCHHERPNGSGYPYGLRAAEIPWSAQIVSVADCFDALTTDRPYQRGKEQAHAFAVMEEMGPGIFAPDLLAVLQAEIRRHGDLLH